MTSLLNIAGNIPVSAAVGGQSLRFEDGDSAYLSRTPASAGNRKTWTWSGWVKRGNLSINNYLFEGGSADTDTNRLFFRFNTDDKISVQTGTSILLKTAQVFRDVSAYYHLVFVCDTTSATADDRMKIYVNGVQVSSFDTRNNRSQNDELGINLAANHSVGFSHIDSAGYLDGYLANVTFIDGTALTPSSFGEYEDTLWKPKSDTDIQALTFGTNGFYLPFKQTTEAEGFSTVTYTGNGVDGHGVEGVGFDADFVWVKQRNGTEHHQLFDTVRGAPLSLSSSGTFAENNNAQRLQSFESGGFTLGNDIAVNQSGKNYVAWCWDAGSGSPVSNTDGTITSSVKANTAKGFSIATYTGTGASGGATVGHGLSSAPEFIITKPRSTTGGWLSGATAIGWTKYIALNSTSAEVTDADAWNNTAPTNSVFSVDSAGGSGYSNGTGVTYVAYSFHSVSGYSSIGSYTGNGSATGPVVTTGFKPAFVMIKRTDGATDWVIVDSTRDPSNPIEDALNPNQSYAENTGYDIDFDSNGFTIKTTTSYMNASGGTYIYMAFADTRDATFFGDTSGNGNNWTPNALNNTDVVLDAPVSGGNFATANPIDPATDATLSEGNLKCVCPNTGSRAAFGNFAVSSGKWYFEGKIISTVSSRGVIGVASVNDYATYADGGWVWYYGLNGQIYYGGSGSAYGSSFNTAVIGVALNMDDREVTFYLNGVSQGVKNLNNSTDAFIPLLAHGQSSNSTTSMFNFGQDSSFAGLETPQGNTDDNGVGDFQYAPPSGFLALATSNLPATTITTPDEYFNTVLWAGNNTTGHAITGVNFQSDWTWIKLRNGASGHRLVDSVRGVTKYLDSTGTSAETTNTDRVTSFDSDGFTLGNSATVNGSFNYVGWNWLAGGTAVSNTSGTITSQVSANTDAGFSVVTYTGNGTTDQTIGHGLGATPDMIIVKKRSTTGNWLIWHRSVTSGNGKYMFLDLTNALSGPSVVRAWDSTNTTTQSSTTTFDVGANSTVNGSGSDYVAYLFSEVEGYSKIGSYTGNGSTDGTFVHCGFRPAWIMVKRTDSTSNWLILDNKREGYNPDQDGLDANGSGAEGTAEQSDFLSNGFKVRNNSSGSNASGGTFIFLAFAEAPFSKSNAR
jgi:hypothetical protein